MQSQDYAGGKWAIGQRTRSVTEAQLDRLYDEGAILRTHVMRPTWHFVLPEDIRWLLQLTGPRIQRAFAARWRQLEIDDGVVARVSEIFAATLAGGHHLSRVELGGALREAGISSEGQRLPHLLMRAELDGLITSGPRRGKQFTHALLDERVPPARRLDRSEAIGELTLRYFRSHGPAQLPDFLWWSGLAAADARTGIALTGAALGHEVIEGKEYWFDAGAKLTPTKAPVAHLLPNFDEYTVGYRDRAAVLHPDRQFDPALFSFGSVLSNVVIVDGRVHGSWRRTLARGGVRVEIRLQRPLRPSEAKAVEKACDALAGFLQRPIELNLLYA